MLCSWAVLFVPRGVSAPPGRMKPTACTVWQANPSSAAGLTAPGPLQARLRVAHPKPLCSPRMAPSWIWGGWERHWVPRPMLVSLDDPAVPRPPQVEHPAWHHDRVGKLRQGSPAAARSPSRLPGPGSGRRCQPGTSGGTQGCQLRQGVSVGQGQAGGLPAPPQPPRGRGWGGVGGCAPPSATHSLGGTPCAHPAGGQQGDAQGVGGLTHSLWGGGGGRGLRGLAVPCYPQTSPLVQWVPAGMGASRDPQKHRESRAPSSPLSPPPPSPGAVGGEQGKLGG